MNEITETAEATPTERRELLRGHDRLQWLRRMLEIRAVEERTLQMFRDGHVSGSTHTCQGQEAVAIGIAVAARDGDGVACTYRGHGHALALGATPRAVLGEIAGRTVGTTGGVGGSMHLSSPDVGLLPTFAIIGAGIPVAVGVGLAAQVHGTDDVGIAVFGDGTTNIGAFHEGLNLASVWKVPCVFVIENNLYGEYSPQRLTTPIDDLADRAASYAIPGEVIDGQDVDAVIDAMNRSLERARAGEGPTLLEMKTYRYAGHSRSDQGLYRPEGELEEWKLRDPIRLLADGLVAEGVLTDTALEELETSYSEVIDQITAEVLDAPMPPREEILANVWA